MAYKKIDMHTKTCKFWIDVCMYVNVHLGYIFETILSCVKGDIDCNNLNSTCRLNN